MLEPQLLETGNFESNVCWKKRLETPAHLFKKEEHHEILVNFECARFNTHFNMI